MALNDARIKGISIGSWLLMEGYILGGRNIPESLLKEKFRADCGEKELASFSRSFRDNFITEGDFRIIAQMGANTVRVPFNCRLIESRPYVYSEDGFVYFSRLLGWAKKYGLKVILDLHAAPGSQNPDWHADCRGKVLFWEKASCRRRAALIWERIAERFAGHDGLLGYDVMNEPVLGKASEKLLAGFYTDSIARIRRHDKNGVIFLEGHNWGREIDFISGLLGPKIQVSIHFYEPIQYTFNFAPDLRYPGRTEGRVWNRQQIFKCLEPYYNFSRRHNVGIYVGEFGVNWRGGYFGELDWVRDTLAAFREFNFGYTYWTYKAVAGKVYPDGLYQYIPNSKFVKREGPVYGWENYPLFWRKEKRQLRDFWRTRGFTANRGLIGLLEEDFAN